ncbi:MAG: nicotinamide mononucleotide transporter [Bacteroidia bacterium]|nr:nicotinamide mononucleotide transporter [Bacteroidota bacterium]MBK8363047.1 nicotinamide mononucleotide transporter [Bacteroidota bacterium]MBP6428273.1 nicotinamide mononucleotide transporter [Bacteroidia bacterium]
MFEFTILGQQSSLIEVLGFITGVTGVWLTVRQNILCFPVGIINVALYAIMFSSEGIRLYADSLLQCIYLFLLIYGWIHWKKSRKSFTIPAMTFVSFSTNMILISFLAFISLSFFLQKFTDASLPWLDSALTILSLVAQWMVAKKIITNWVIWIIVNSVYIPLYYYKGLPLTSILYFIFLILAIKGYYEWKKDLGKTNSVA